MSPRARAIAIVAACAALPHFLPQLWLGIVYRLPIPFEISSWILLLGPALVAAFTLKPSAARLGLVVQPFVPVLLPRPATYPPPAPPSLAALVLIAAGAGLAGFLTKGTSATVAPVAPTAGPAPAAPAAPRRS